VQTAGRARFKADRRMSGVRSAPLTRCGPLEMAVDESPMAPDEVAQHLMIALSVIRPPIQIGRGQKLPDQSDRDRREAAKAMVDHAERCGIKWFIREPGPWNSSRSAENFEMAFDGDKYRISIAETHALPEDTSRDLFCAAINELVGDKPEQSPTPLHSRHT
jgi:hypothetical protein